MSLWLWFTISITMHSHHQSINCFHLKSTFHVECIQNSHVCYKSDICSELVAGMPFDPLKCLWSQGPLQFCGTLVGLSWAQALPMSLNPIWTWVKSPGGSTADLWGICYSSDEDYACKILEEQQKLRKWRNKLIFIFDKFCPPCQSVPPTPAPSPSRVALGSARK